MMSRENPLVEALKRLCNREGGYREVAEAAHVSADNLWQILNGTKLPSGNPRGVGAQLQKKIDKAYPGWLNIQTGETQPYHQSKTTPATADDNILPYVIDNNTPSNLATMLERLQRALGNLDDSSRKIAVILFDDLLTGKRSSLDVARAIDALKPEAELGKRIARLTVPAEIYHFPTGKKLYPNM